MVLETMLQTALQTRDVQRGEARACDIPGEVYVAQHMSKWTELYFTTVLTKNMMDKPKYHAD